MKTLTYRFYLSVAVILFVLASNFVISTHMKNSRIADAKELSGWQSERGYFTDKELKDYQHDDPKTLETLAHAGDLKAITSLADFHSKNDDTHAAAHYYEMGAIRGSTSAISLLAIETVLKASQEKENRKPAVFEALAIARVLTLRGDAWHLQKSTDTLIDLYESLFNEKLNISVEDQGGIDQRAKEIYNNWAAKRKELGLGEFDNSVPVKVKKHLDIVYGPVTTH